MPWPENTSCPWLLPVSSCPLRAQETGFGALFSRGRGWRHADPPEISKATSELTLCSGQHLAVQPLARIAKRTGFGVGHARGSVGLHAWWHWEQRWFQGAAAPMGRGPARPPTRLSAGWEHVWVPGLRGSGSGATAEMLRQMVRGGRTDLSIRAGNSGAPPWISVGRTDIQWATSPTPSWKPLASPSQVYPGGWGTGPLEEPGPLSHLPSE